MVSLRRNKVGNWEARVSLGSDVLGARKRVQRTFPGELDEKDAMDRAVDFERSARGARRAGGEISAEIGGAMTVREWLDAYLASKEAFGASPASIPTWKTYVTRYAGPRIGAIRLYDLRPQHVEAMLAQVAREGGVDGGPVSLKTLCGLHSWLQGAMTRAVRYGYIARNPVTADLRPKAQRHEAASLDVDELSSLLAATDGRWDLGSVAARLALGAGLRRAEACGLLWRDIDDSTRTLHVSKVVVAKPGGGLVRKDPKSKAGVRAIRLDDETWAWLMEWRSVQAGMCPRAGKMADAAVVSMDGRLAAPNAVSRSFAALRADAGLSGCGLHTLRHTHATHLLAEGVDVKVLQRRLGHSSAAMTLDTYSHVLPGADEAAAEAMAAVIGRRRDEK